MLNQYLNYLQEEDRKPHLMKRAGTNPSILSTVGIVNTLSMKDFHKSSIKWERYAAKGFLAAWIIIISTSIYKNYLSKNAIKCKNTSNKLKCMSELEYVSLEESIKFLNSNKTKCKNDKDPNKCYKKIEEKIIKLEKRKNNKKETIAYYERPGWK